MSCHLDIAPKAVFGKNRDDYLQYYGYYSRFIAELNIRTSEVARKFKNINLKPRTGTLTNRNLVFQVSFTVKNFREKLSEEINGYSNILHSYHKEVVLRMETGRVFEIDDEDLLTLRTIFTFPEAIKVFCVQYFLYFAQFLKDLGINARPELKDDAGKILFSIVPTDELTGLENIREALAVYLSLPASPMIFDDSFAAMRLQQQVENLQHSQKMAARELQLTENFLSRNRRLFGKKNIVISQKDSTIEQQNRIIEKIMSKSIMMDSLENKEEFEKIFDGLEVGESKWLKDNLGIKVNPVKSLKSLGGKLLKKDKEIVTLDLVDQEEQNDADN